MTRQRSSQYIYVTWIAKPLVGEISCHWAPWFKTNYQGYTKAPSTFDSARWNMEHTDLMNEHMEKLEARGHKLFIERQNEFKTQSRHSGMVIHGRPDIIAVDPDGRATIYDVKTGRESDSHVAQVQLYMYLIPRALSERWRGTTFDGALVYPDGREKLVPASSIDEPFVNRVAEFISKMVSDSPARRVPSASECRFCDISGADCHERVEWRDEQPISVSPAN